MGKAPAGTSLAEFTLTDKYTRQEGTIYLSGVQMLVRLPLDHHLADRRRGLNTATLISGYQGSPLGGLDLDLQRHSQLLRQHHVHFVPGLNEELAATAVWGSQTVGKFPGARYDGVVGMWYGKAPGLDRTSDALRHANLVGTGRNSGALFVVGDDPMSKSSTIPSHSEMALQDVGVPTFYPGNVQEVLDLGLHALMLSRASGLIAGLKIVTNVADGSGTAEVSPERITPVPPTLTVNGQPFQHQQHLILAAPFNLEMERTLHGERLELARLYVRANGLNRAVVPTPGAWLGIVAAGKTYYDLRQALSELGLDEETLRRYGIRVLKIDVLFPLESGIIRSFAQGLHEILVVEEKRPFLETAIRDILYGMTDRPVVVGKAAEDGTPLLLGHSELDVDTIARAVAGRLGRRVEISSVIARLRYLESRSHQASEALPVKRTPFFCSGCPHNRSTVLPPGATAGAGIGCHGMAQFNDPNHMDITQMGGEGAQWVGMAPFTEKRHRFQNMGDGTFAHSGLQAIKFAVAAGVNITYKLLYNSVVAMTGGQAAVGLRPVPDLTRLLEAEGVRRIIITTADPDQFRRALLAKNAQVWHRDDLVRAQEILAATPGVTVLIHADPCATELRRMRKRGKAPQPAAAVVINERVCEGCGDCAIKSNCISLQSVETEFGTKRRIHQSSCNQDYSCLRGDCPAMITVERGPAAKKALPVPEMNRDLPEPDRVVLGEPFSVRMVGIGGTGVLTLSQILGTAAMLSGLRVCGLDQTGLSQKNGPVVSDLRFMRTEEAVANKLSTGGADLYLVLDLLAGTDPRNLAVCDPQRTVAVVSTSRVPTGQMVANPALQFPPVEPLRSAIDRVSRRGAGLAMDAAGIAEALFGDHMAAGIMLLGAAYQRGALPVRGADIELAIQLNGAAVRANLAAFRWGRLAVLQPERLSAAADPVVHLPQADSAADQMVEATGFTGQLRRLLEVRIPELVAYQDAAYAREYAAFVQMVAERERQVAPGQTRLAEAVARWLFKLMAYKDEYEVARLHVDAMCNGTLTGASGAGARFRWHLHPPFLRGLGLSKKISLGAWFTPVLQLLAGMKRLRGNALDPFGYAAGRRLERSLVQEYRQFIQRGVTGLSADTYETVIALAELPDMIRGFEAVKLESVAGYRKRAAQLLDTLTRREPAEIHSA